MILDDGGMLGVMTTSEALKEAHKRGLDLVEVNPKAVPPVCKILDFGKFKYEEKKKQREAKKRQTVVEVKEIKLRPKTDDHDLEVKVRAARRFLESGNKVKFTVRFRGREIMHPDRARMQLDLVTKQCEDLALIEQRASMEARAMSLLIAPKPQVLQRLASKLRKAERARGADDESPSQTDADVPSQTGDDDDDVPSQTGSDETAEA